MCTRAHDCIVDKCISMKKGLSLLVFVIFALTAIGQSVSLQGYVYETDNRGYIRQVKVDILELTSKAFITSVLTDADGFFKADVPAGKKLLVRADKDLFQRKEVTVDASDKAPGEKAFVNIELERKPGYIFDVTLANPRDNANVTTQGIHGATIEVFNNTTEKEEVHLPDYEFPNFKVNFAQGNHYTLLIRKEGYYSKRMEAYVNIKGCILCFDGVGSVQPGVSDVLTAGHQMGTLLANVEMKPIVIDEKTKLDNIIYATGSAELNAEAKLELQKVATLLKDNPGMKVELSSHTDSRGKSDMNMKLSQERARVASEYVASFKGLNQSRVRARGYGETRLDNRCADGVECNERQHQRNRRTEVQILEFVQPPKSQWKPLAELKRLEKMEETLAALQNQEVIQIPVDASSEDDIPEDLKKQLGMEENQATQADKAETPKPNFESKIKQTAPEVKKTMPPSPPKQENMVEEIEMVETPKPSGESLADIERRIEEKASMANAKKMEVEEDVVIDVVDDPGPFYEVEVAESNYADLKSIPTGYNGFMIQVHESAARLPDSHELFQVFGNLTMEKTPKGFAYLLGDFKEADDAERFLSTIIKPRFPEAQLVKYEVGRRLIYKN